MWQKIIIKLSFDASKYCLFHLKQNLSPQTRNVFIYYITEYSTILAPTNGKTSYDGIEKNGAFQENFCGTDYLVALQNYIIIMILKKEDRLTKIGLEHNC